MLQTTGTLQRAVTVGSLWHLLTISSEARACILYTANSNRAVDVAAEVHRCWGVLLVLPCACCYFKARRVSRCQKQMVRSAEAITELSTERLEDLFETQAQELFGALSCFDFCRVP